MAKTWRKLLVALGKMLAVPIRYVLVLLVIAFIHLCHHFVLLWKLLQSFPLFENTFRSMRRFFASTIYLVGHPRSGSGVDPRMEQSQRRRPVTLKEALATLIRYFIFALILLFIAFCYQIVILLNLLQSFVFIQNLGDSIKRSFRRLFAAREVPAQLSSARAKQVYQRRPAEGQVPERTRTGSSLSTPIKVWHLPFLSLPREEDLEAHLRRRTAQHRWGLPRRVLRSLRALLPPAAPSEADLGQRMWLPRSPDQALTGGGHIAASEEQMTSLSIPIEVWHLPFLSFPRKEDLEAHLRRRTAQHRWGLPGRVLRSLRALLPPAAPSEVDFDVSMSLQRSLQDLTADIEKEKRRSEEEEVHREGVPLKPPTSALGETQGSPEGNAAGQGPLMKEDRSPSFGVTGGGDIATSEERQLMEPVGKNKRGKQVKGQFKSGGVKQESQRSLEERKTGSGRRKGLFQLPWRKKGLEGTVVGEPSTRETPAGHHQAPDTGRVSGEEKKRGSIARFACCSSAPEQQANEEPQPSHQERKMGSGRRKGVFQLPWRKKGSARPMDGEPSRRETPRGTADGTGEETPSLTCCLCCKSVEVQTSPSGRHIRARSWCPFSSCWRRRRETPAGCHQAPDTGRAAGKEKKRRFIARFPCCSSASVQQANEEPQPSHQERSPRRKGIFQMPWRRRRSERTTRQTPTGTVYVIEEQTLSITCCLCCKSLEV